MSSPTRPTSPKRGKRTKRRVDIFDPVAAAAASKRAKSSHFSPARVGEVGAGVALGDIEVTAAHIGRLPSKHDLLAAVHILCYGRKGTKLERKRNLRKFSGFTFGSDSAAYDKTREKMLAQKPWTTKCVNDLCILFDLKRGASKEATVDIIMAFMMSPEAKP